MTIVLQEYGPTMLFSVVFFITPSVFECRGGKRFPGILSPLNKSGKLLVRKVSAIFCDGVMQFKVGVGASARRLP